ncbi:MAG: hypothetical protein M3P14_02405 [Chloroflexota bacterium]|nr:hypothetical protein [Chloroflexota bacterium]
MKTVISGPMARPFSLPARLAALAGLLAAVSALAGLFVPNLYRDSEAWVRQARAADLVTLVAVVPVLGWSLWQSARGSLVGRIGALAAAGYLVYNYAIFGFAVAINPMTPLHIAVLGLAAWSTMLSVGSLLDKPALRNVAPGLPRRTSAAFLLAVTGLFALMWTGQIAQAIASGQVPAEVARLRLVTNPVYTLDLAFALPFLAFAGWWLLRRAPNAAAIALIALTWSALMGLGVLAIFAFDAVAGAAVALPVAGLIGLITIVAAGLVALSLRAPGGNWRLDRATE